MAKIIITESDESIEDATKKAMDHLNQSKQSEQSEQTNNPPRTPEQNAVLEEIQRRFPPGTLIPITQSELDKVKKGMDINRAMKETFKDILDSQMNQPFNPPFPSPSPSFNSPNQPPPISADDERLMQFFSWEAHPADEQSIIVEYAALAKFIIATLPPNPERTVAIRELLESLDNCLRAKKWK